MIQEDPQMITELIKIENKTFKFCKLNRLI
jgi:hypothetical protein